MKMMKIKKLQTKIVQHEGECNIIILDKKYSKSSYSFTYMIVYDKI